MSDDGKVPVQHKSLADVEHALIHHTELPRTAPADALDAVVAFIGKTASWLWLAVVAVILYSVISRYLFGFGSVMLEEVQWHIASFVWLIGLSYTLTSDDHVRVDVLHERLTLRTQTWIEVAGILLLLLPFLAIEIWEAIPYFLSSYEQGEVSQAPAGLPARWALKLVLPVSFVLLFLAAVARLLRCTALLFGVPRPRAPDRAQPAHHRP